MPGAGWGYWAESSELLPMVLRGSGLPGRVVLLRGLWDVSKVVPVLVGILGLILRHLLHILLLEI